MPPMMMPVEVPFYAIQQMGGSSMTEAAALWIVSAEGPFSEGKLVDEANYPIVSLRQKKLNKVKQLRDEKDYGGVDTPHGQVDTDVDSQRKISGAVTMSILLGSSFEMTWRMKDNTEVTLNAEGMADLGIAVGLNTAAAQAIKNNLDALLKSATTIEEIDAVDIYSPWNV